MKTLSLLIFAASLNAQMAPIAIGRAAVMPVGPKTVEYDFRQGADTQVLYDKSGNAQNCRLGSSTGVDSADPTWTQGGGLDFNGSTQYAYCPVFSITGDATWVMLYNSGVTGTPPGSSVAVDYDGSFHGWGFRTDSGSGSAGKLSLFNGAWHVPNSAITDASWHLIVVSVSATAYQFYFDGVANGNGAATYAASTTAHLYFGKDSGANYGSGTLGYFAIYPRVLTAQEAAQAWRFAQSILPQKTFRPYGGYKATFPPSFVTVLDNGLARVPPMGWANWNYTNNITEGLFRPQVDAMVSKGLATAGYRYAIIQEPGLEAIDASGQPILRRFPSGLKANCDYIHAAGLLCGFYESPGKLTYSSNKNIGYFQIGSFGVEYDRMKWYASAGVDYLEEDYCSVTGCITSGGYGPQIATYGYQDAMRSVFQHIGQAVQASGREIVYSILTFGQTIGSGWGTAVGANVFRIGGDLGNTWASLPGVKSMFDPTQHHPAYQSVGHWEYLDMLQIGNGTLTDDEGRTHFSLWSILASPLIASTNLLTASTATLATLTNTDVIAVDQDALGIQGVRVAHTACGSDYCDVWVKQLSGTNTCAIGLFNLSSTAQNITATFATIAAVVPACGSGPYATTRDLWAHSSLGTLTTSYTATAVPSHGVFMFRVAP